MLAVERLRATCLAAEQAGDLALECRAATDLGRAWMMLNEPKKAHERFLLALRLAEAARLPQAAALLYGALGRVAFTVGDPDRAILFASRALRANEQLGHFGAHLGDLHVLSDAWLAREDITAFTFILAHTVKLVKPRADIASAGMEATLAEMVPDEIQREQTMQAAREWMLVGFGEVEERLRGMDVFVLG